MTEETTFYDDKFRALQQFGAYQQLPCPHTGENRGYFHLKMDRNYSLVVIKLDPPGDAKYAEQHLRLYRHLREMKTFCTDSLMPSGNDPGCVYWVCRAVLSRENRSLPSLGLTLIHHLPPMLTVQLTDGNGAPASNQQDKINDLENLITRYGKQVVKTEDQLKPLIDAVIGEPERVITKTNETTTSSPSADDAKATEAEESIMDNDDGITVHLPDEAKKIIPSKPLSLLFPPIGEINVVAGQENSGKTSLLINEVVKVSNDKGAVAGVNVLVMSYDLRYEFLSQYLLAYQCEPNRVIVVDKPKTWDYMESLIKKYSINAVVLDSMLDFFSTYSSLYLTNKEGKEMDFDPDKQLSWVRAFGWFIPIMQRLRLSVLGVLHAPKGRFAHGLPHSSKLGGYLWNYWILYRKGRDMKAHPCRWLVENFEHANKRTQMLFQGRERLGEIKHWFYEYGEEVERSLLNDKVDFVPRKLVNWQRQDEDNYDREDDEDAMFGHKFVIPDADGIIKKIREELGQDWQGRSKLERRFNCHDEYRKAMLFYRLNNLVSANRLEQRDRNSGISYRLKSKQASSGE